MSTIELDPAGLGISKRYGPLSVGGVGGELPNSGTQKELVFELTAGEIFASGITLNLPANYLIESLYLEVEEAFASSSSADLVVSGGAGLTTDFDLSSASAITSVVLTGMTLLSGTSATTITLTPSSEAIATAVASPNPTARIVVQYKSV